MLNLMQAKTYEKICVFLKNGSVAEWKSSEDEWDDYLYDEHAFIIKKDGAYVGVYNMDAVHSIVVS